MFIDNDIIDERLNSNENLLHEINSLLKDNSKKEKSSNEESHPKDMNEEQVTRLLDEALNPDDYARSNTNARRGRGKELTYEERADIGVLATVTSTYEAARMLNVSTGQTAVYRSGKTNFYDEPQETPLKTRLRNKLDDIAEASAERLLQIIGVIDDTAISNLRDNALKASQVGTNLARIIEKVQPKEDSNDRNLTQFIMIQHAQAKEEDYDVIDVK